MQTYKDVFLTEDGYARQHTGEELRFAPRMTRRRNLYGVGINDFGNAVVGGGTNRIYWKPYALWSSMLSRAYDTKLKNRHPSYEDVTVDSNWNRFSVFLEWLFSQKYISHDFQLDKDLIGCGKFYGPDDCVMVPHWVNTLVLSGKKPDILLPMGVSKDKNSFAAKVRCQNRPIMSKNFKTVGEAVIWYHTKKQEYVDDRKEELDFIHPNLYQGICRILAKRREEACISSVL